MAKTIPLSFTLTPADKEALDRTVAERQLIGGRSELIRTALAAIGAINPAGVRA